MGGEMTTVGKVCLLVNDSTLFPEFHSNLLEACRLCELAIQEAVTPPDILHQLAADDSSVALLILDLEILKQFSEEDAERLQLLLAEKSIPTLGLGFFADEAAQDCRRFQISHFLLKYQDPAQTLSMLRAVTYPTRKGEKRQHLRFLVNLPARFQFAGENYSAEVQDISAGGAFLKSYIVPDLGDEIWVDIKTPQADTPITCFCQVRHCRRKALGDASPEAPGMGLQFLQLVETSATLLAKLLRHLQEHSTAKTTAH